MQKIALSEEGAECSQGKWEGHEGCSAWYRLCIVTTFSCDTAQRTHKVDKKEEGHFDFQFSDIYDLVLRKKALYVKRP